MALANRENQLLANGFYYRLNENGEAIICGAEVWPEVLIIPEALDGHTVVEIGDYAFDTDNAADSVCFCNGPVSMAQISANFMDIMVADMVRNRLKKVVLPESIRRIGSCSFYQNNGITEINIPRNVREIGALAFANVWGVKRFEIPVGANVYKEYPADEWWDDQAAFEGCEGAEIVFV